MPDYRHDLAFEQRVDALAGRESATTCGEFERKGRGDEREANSQGYPQEIRRYGSANCEVRSPGIELAEGQVYDGLQRRPTRSLRTAGL